MGLGIALGVDRTFSACLCVSKGMFGRLQRGAPALMGGFRSYQRFLCGLRLFSHLVNIKRSKCAFGGIFPIAQIGNTIGQCSSCCCRGAQLGTGLGKGGIGETGALTGNFQLQLGSFTLWCCFINLFLQFDDLLAKPAVGGCRVIAQVGLARHVTADLLLLCLQPFQRIPDSLFLAVKLVPAN